ncbi:hypothetical protein GN956_G15000 [Arapaima gigas]
MGSEHHSVREGGLCQQNEKRCSVSTTSRLRSKGDRFRRDKVSHNEVLAKIRDPDLKDCFSVLELWIPSSASPQKPAVKNRSKSTEEIQQAKKAFHTTQKSLPGRCEMEELKGNPEGSEMPSSSSEELK